MILIVDDDHAVLHSLALLLKQAGFSSAGAADPQAALGGIDDPHVELVLQDMNFGLRFGAIGTDEDEGEVTFEINADGIVSVHAKDMETGQHQSITVTASSSLTRDEIQQMVEQSHDFAVARRNSEETEQAKQEAERLIAERVWSERAYSYACTAIRGASVAVDAFERAYPWWPGSPPS